MLSILRIVVGLLYLEHGTQKIFNFPPRPNPRAYELFTLVPGLAGILELVGGILIVLGLFTRPVAFLLSGEMAFAYFMSHAPRGFFPIDGRQRRRAGDSLLLYLSLLLLCRGRRVEPRRNALARRTRRRRAARPPLTPPGSRLRGPAELTRRPAGWIVS